MEGNMRPIDLEYVIDELKGSTNGTGFFHNSFKMDMEQSGDILFGWAIVREGKMYAIGKRYQPFCLMKAKYNVQKEMIDDFLREFKKIRENAK